MRFLRNCLMTAAIALSSCTPAFAQTIGNPIAVAHSAASETGHVFKTSYGYLYDINVAIATTSGYVMVFDSTTVPADGAVTPILCFQTASAYNQNISLAYPVPFQNGLSVAFSTTGCFTKTGSNAFFSAQFK